MENKEEKVVVNQEVVTEPVKVEEKPIEEKTAEEIKAEAEKLEAEIKELKEKGNADEYKNNQIIRLQKAMEKKESLLGQKSDVKEGLDTRDLITLSKVDIAEDSEKAKILAKYKAGGIIKDYSEGLNNIAIKAEFEALDAKNNAKAIIDESDTDEVKVKTTKEVINSYRNSGQVPVDPKAQKAIAEDNLKQMGIK